MDEGAVIRLGSRVYELPMVVAVRQPDGTLRQPPPFIGPQHVRYGTVVRGPWYVRDSKRWAVHFDDEDFQPEDCSEGRLRPVPDTPLVPLPDRRMRVRLLGAPEEADVLGDLLTKAGIRILHRRPQLGDEWTVDGSPAALEHVIEHWAGRGIVDSP